MKMKYYLILPMAFCLSLMACNQQGENEDTVTAATTEMETPQDEAAPLVRSEKMEVPPVAGEKTLSRPESRQQATPAAAKPKPATAPAKPKSQSETFYVETYGAQGKVWGHVTMSGDRGTGTIHDYDENTLAVTVTRHGDELFAVDQNSRQYVFKLKNKN